MYVETSIADVGTDDFIRGVDNIPDRDILDFNMNKYGEMLTDFLINTNMCFLNGRGELNDFTSVSSNGRTVVDYCFVSHSNLNTFSNFSVTRSCEVINQSGSISTVNHVGIKYDKRNSITSVTQTSTLTLISHATGKFN